MLTNRFRRALLLSLALLAAAIDWSGNTTYPPTVSSVQVTPGVDSLTAIGQTHQFTAVVKDQYGNPMTGKAVVWRSCRLLLGRQRSGPARRRDHGHQDHTGARGAVGRARLGRG